MAKLALLLATFALVLFLTDASIYRATITTSTSESEESSCEQQIKEQKNLWHCQKYLEEQTSSRSYNRPGSSRHLDSCCEQLDDLDKKCRCPGLEVAVSKQLEEGELGKEETQEMYEVAEKVMKRCEMEPRGCDLQSRNWA
ncbi:hypothetical protein PTKIN_Ptkin11bG0169900 [Pterospermum kingtungense]